MKKLQEQRKGEDDNVIPFEMPQLATSPKPPGKDWLRELPFGCRFLCKAKSSAGSLLQWYGIADVQEKGVLLGTDHPFNPGHLKFDWFDSVIFSEQHRFIQVLLDKTIEEGQPPEEGAPDG